MESTVPSLRVRSRFLLDDRRFMGFIFLLPAVLYIVLLVGIPFITAIMFSLTDVNVGNTELNWVGLTNFENVWKMPDFHTSLVNTFVFAILSQVGILVSANLIAVILTTPLPENPFVKVGMWFARFLIIMPWATPVALAVVGWLWMFDSKYSPIDFVLRELGLLGPGTIWGPFNNMVWLGKPILAKASIIFVQIWRMTPLAAVILMAGLTSIPNDIIDQTKVDGSRFFRTLFQVKLPLIMPIMIISMLFSFILTFGDLTVVYILTRGGPITHTLTLPMYSFKVGIDGGNLAQGAAISLFIFPVLLAVTLVTLRIASRSEVV